MARPFYPQEADDADLDWLISNFLYERPNYIPVEVGTLPLVLIPYREITEKNINEINNSSDEAEINSRDSRNKEPP